MDIERFKHFHNVRGISQKRSPRLLEIEKSFNEQRFYSVMYCEDPLFFDIIAVQFDTIFEALR